MRLTISGVLIVGLLLSISIAPGCSGLAGRNGVQTPESDAANPGAASDVNLPPLPSGANDVRHASLFDSDNVNGATAFSSLRATVAGTSSLLEPLTGPGDTLAYAIYQIVARPLPDVPYGMNINAYYLDPTPTLNNPGEGYYFAYSNYDEGHWIISGPTTGGNARAFFSAGADVVSPGGFIYVAVIAVQGLKVRVDEVSMGYFTVPGELEDVIGRIPGDTAGKANDIQVSPDGDLQIAYVHAAAMLSDSDLRARVARQVGSTWATEEIVTPYFVENPRLALGSAHRRALILTDESNGDLHLFYDNGSGTFGPDVLVEAATQQYVLPAVLFINSADVPGGPQDLALIAYAIQSGGNIQTKYYTYNGAVIASGNLLPAATAEPGAVTLTHSPTGTAIFSVPVKPLLTWQLQANVYSAAADAWAPLLAPALDMPDISTDQFNPSVQVFGGAGMTTIAAFTREDPMGVQVQVSDGIVWSDLFADRVFCVSRGSPDVEQVNPSELAFVTRAGAMMPVLYMGNPNSGIPWTQQLLDPTPFSGTETSLAVDSSGVMHIASLDANLGALRYYRREPGGSVTTQIADPGSSTAGLYFGPAEVVWVDGQMHIFGSDISHFLIRHSVNENGIWLVENEPLPVFSPSYMLTGAGYIPGSDFIYATYIDIVDIALGVTYGPPDGSNWQTMKLVDNALELAVTTDNGTTLGLMTVQQNMMSSGPALYFTEATLGGVISDKELVFADDELLDIPWTLDCSPDDNRWYGVFCDGASHVAYSMRREGPGVWSGPFKFAEQYGADGEVKPAGLSHAPDGTKYAVIRERVDATDLVNVRIYSAPPGSIEFHPAGLAVTYDLASRMVEGIAITPGPGGQPAIAVVQKQIPAVNWDITVFMPNGSGLWPQLLNMNTSIRGPMAVQIGFGFDLTDTGQPLMAIVEGDDTASNIGRIMTYYPF